VTLAYVGLGANLGDREATIRAALAALAEEDAIEVVAVSTLREGGCDEVVVVLGEQQRVAHPLSMPAARARARSRSGVSHVLLRSLCR